MKAKTSLAVFLPAVLLTLTLAPQAAAQCISAPDGLVSWWRAEGNSLDWLSANNGIAQGDVSFAPGEVGQGFFFSGSAWILVPASPTLNVGSGGGLTLEAWIKPYDVESQHVIAEYNDGNGNIGVQLWHSIWAYGGLGSLFANIIDNTGNYHYFASAPGILDTNYQHVAVTYDKATGMARLYRNGVVVAAESLGFFTPQTTYALGLGTRRSGAGQGSYFTGIMDEVSLFSRALTGEEIQAVYSAGASGKCSAPTVAYIVKDPLSQSVPVGESVTLTVAAGGTAPLSYQWTHCGTNLPGATTASLTYAHVAAEQAGPYTVLVSNSLGQAISSEAVLTILPGPECTTPPTGIAGWWRGEGDGTDYLGANNGTLYGGVSFAPGRVGSAFVFDGIAGHVRVRDTEALRFTRAMTVEVWVYPTRSGRIQNLVTRWDAVSGPDQRSYGLGLETDNRAYFTVTRDGLPATGKGVYTANVLPLNTWSHVAATYDGKALKIYFNGALQSSISYADVGDIFDGSGDLAIGGSVVGEPLGSAGYLFAGMLDEPTLYARALSDSEILALYSSRAAGKCLVAVAPFIAIQPVSSTAIVGDTVTLKVTAVGTAPMSYSWRSNETVLDWATNASLVLTNVQESFSGSYSVVVTNAAGSAGSSNATLTVLPAPPCAPAPAGLVGWWPGESNAGDQVNLNNGTLAGDASYGTGKVGQGFRFDGNGDAVQLGYTTNLWLQDLTIETWLKRADPTKSSVSYPDADIFAMGFGGYAFGMFGDGRLFLGKISYSHIPSTISVTDTNFHHVAVTKSGSAVTFYVDGVSNRAPSYDPGFMFDTPTSLGARGDNLWNGFWGTIDELAVYARALSGAEVKAIYDAGSSGKCSPAYPPFIYVQPANRSVVVGADVTFSVQVAGTAPFTYQWKRNGVNLEGKTGSSLTLLKVQMGDSGNYSVGVTNAFGGTQSSNAVLTVSLPPALVQVMDTVGQPAGGTATVPVILVANGNENALGFSLGFDTSKLTFVEAVAGSGASGAQLLVSDSLLASGKVGLAIALPSGTTISPGTQEVARVVFTSAPATAAVSTRITFGDQPTVRQISDAAAVALPASYAGGTLSYPPSQFEADIAPRPNGDVGVTIIDWVQAGRYVARLDYPTNASEFQRADCAPRSSQGDGAITVSDWVQAGRYAAGIDPWELAGGPTQEVSPGLNGPVRQDATRTVRISDALLLDVSSNQIAVQLEAQGDESAISFSLSFDKNALVYVGTANGSGLGDATLNVNTGSLNEGKIGFAAGMMNKTFGLGTRELVKVTFRAATNSGTYPVALTDQPVPRGVSDTNALGLNAEYINGTIYVNPLPGLKIKAGAANITLAWPGWATNFVLQEASEPVNTPTSWTTVATKPEVLNGEQVLTLPISGSTRFYRLQR